MRKVPTKPCRACGASDRYANGRCRPCQQAKNATWLAVNQERARATATAYRDANREHKNALGRERYEANRERESARKAASYAANPQKAKAQIASWRARNPEAKRAMGHTRRVKKRSRGKLSPGIVPKLFSLQKGKCACCGEPLGSAYEIDHVLPIALGGTNTDDNVQLLRKECNRRKAAKHPVDYMQSLGLLL